MNYVEKLAEMLGIKVGAPFKINENNNRYRFDEDGTFSWEEDDGYWSRDLVLTGHFLQRMFTVKWKPKQGESYYVPDPLEPKGYARIQNGLDKNMDDLLNSRSIRFRTEEEAIAKAKEYGWFK